MGRRGEWEKFYKWTEVWWASSPSGGPSVKGPTVKKSALWLILGRGQYER